MEYSQWKTGLRREAIIYGFFYFSQKLAAACAGFITGIGLTLCGYIQPKFIDNMVTAQIHCGNILTGLKSLTTVIPLALIICGIVFISLYPLNEKMHKDIVQKI